MGSKIAIIAADYHPDITQRLISSAQRVLRQHSIAPANVKKVAGAFEIPLAAGYCIDRYDGLITLGCVVRGETEHFSLIIEACSTAVMQLMLAHHKPIGFGVLAADNIEQAIARSGSGEKNRGAEAALAVVRMLELQSDMTTEV